MSALTLKNIPDELLNSLRQAAEHDRRSLNQEVLHILSLALIRRSKTYPATPAEITGYIRAYQQHPDDLTEFSDLTQVMNATLTELSWDET